MKIKNWVLPLVVFAAFWGVIGFSMATGTWQTKQTNDDVTVMSSEDLKGWMTLEDLSVYTKVTPYEVIKVLGIPETTAHNKKLKDIAAELGVETDDLKKRLDQFFIGSGNGQPAKEEATSEGPAAPTAATDGGVEHSEEAYGTEKAIKGSMNLLQVEKTTGVPVTFICEKVGLPIDVDRNVPMRDLTQIYNFEVSEVREAVAIYKK